MMVIVYFQNGVGKLQKELAFKLLLAMMGLRCFFFELERLDCVEIEKAVSLRKRMNSKRRCSDVVETDDLPLCFRELLKSWLVYET